jgi:hypothetical protein
MSSLRDFELDQTENEATPYWSRHAKNLRISSAEYTERKRERIAEAARRFQVSQWNFVGIFVKMFAVCQTIRKLFVL